jgi:hypothetical protein
MPRYITLNENSVVIGVRNGASLVGNEIENEVGDIGQIMQGDGTFITPEPVPTAPQISLDAKVEQLQQDNLILMDALAMTFEEVMMLRMEMGGTV